MDSPPSMHRWSRDDAETMETWDEAGMSGHLVAPPAQLESRITRRNLNEVHLEPTFLKTLRNGDLQQHQLDAYQEYHRLCAFHGLRPNSAASICLYSRYKLLKLSRTASERDLIPVVDLLTATPPHARAAFVRGIDVTSLRMGSVAALLIAEIIRRAPQIRTLHLADNFLRDDGVAILFEALRENTTVEVLDLRSNRISQRGARRMAELMWGAPVTQVGSPSPMSLGLLDRKKKVAGEALKELVVINNLMMQDGVDNLTMVCRARNIKIQDDGNQVLAEILNSATHGFGLLASLVAGVYMVDEAQNLPTRLYVSILTFCVALSCMFGSSCFFHTFFRVGPIRTRIKAVLRVLDHCSIFFLIAATYTPILLKFIWSPDHPGSAMGPVLFYVVWTFALAGVLVSSGALTRLAPSRQMRSILGLTMGWMVLISIRTLWQRMPSNCLALLVCGGLSYTFGVPFYMRGHDFAMYHVVWHITVMFGAAFHYLMILFFVVESNVAPDSCLAG